VASALSRKLAQLLQVSVAGEVRHDTHVLKPNWQIVPPWVKAAVVRVILALVQLPRKLRVRVSRSAEPDCRDGLRFEDDGVPVAHGQWLVRLELGTEALPVFAVSGINH